MAQTIEDARALSRTNVHGRRLGISQNEFLVGVKGVVKTLANATSDTTEINLANNGYHTVVTTTNDTWTLNDPQVGVSVTIATGSSSTGIHTIVPANASFITSATSTGKSVTLIGGNASVTLFGATTALWAVAATRGSSAQTHVTTA